MRTTYRITAHVPPVEHRVCVVLFDDEREARLRLKQYRELDWQDTNFTDFQLETRQVSEWESADG